MSRKQKRMPDSPQDDLILRGTITEVISGVVGLVVAQTVILKIITLMTEYLKEYCLVIFGYRGNLYLHRQDGMITG